MPCNLKCKTSHRRWDLIRYTLEVCCPGEAADRAHVIVRGDGVVAAALDV